MEMDERSFVTKDETSGKSLTSNSRTARLDKLQLMVQNPSDFRAEGNQSKERKPALVSNRAQGLEADFDSPLNWTLKQN